MFNMYDDAGIKTQIINPYQVKKLEPISKLTNKATEKTNSDEQNTSAKHPSFGSEAKNAYKKMADMHIEEKILHVYQLMHTDFVTLKETDTIDQCWQLMEENDVKQIPVIGFSGKIKGLVTMKNLTKALIDNLNNPRFIYETAVDNITIHDIMTAEPISDIRRVTKVMMQYHLNTIPIVDTKTDEIVGVISRADILKAVATNIHLQLWA